MNSDPSSFSAFSTASSDCIINIVYFWQARAKYTNHGAMTRADKNEQSKPTMNHISVVSCFVFFVCSRIYFVWFGLNEIPYQCMHKNIFVPPRRHHLSGCCTSCVCRVLSTHKTTQINVRTQATHFIIQNPADMYSVNSPEIPSRQIPWACRCTYHKRWSRVPPARRPQSGPKVPRAWWSSRPDPRRWSTRPA